jgi:hypothetical protein
MHFFSRTFIAWLPIAIAVTGLSGLVYLAIQQDLRQSADDPQIQMAEDAAVALDAGAKPTDVVPDDSIDIGASLAPFIMVFDTQGDLVVGTAELHGAAPSLPAGVFDASGWKTPESDRFTWQPEAGVREAVVLVRGENGEYVAAGRSLREVEKRESQLTDEVLLAWAATLFGSLVLALFARFLLRGGPGE